VGLMYTKRGLHGAESHRASSRAWNHRHKDIRNRKQERLLLRYGISYETYLLVLMGQNYACALCGSPHRFHVDHNHKTGEFCAR
jgi:hypothetical protein